MKTLDLFCGCGGLSLGFEKAGYEIIGAYDAWPAAINTYNANMSHQAALFDLSDTSGFLKEIKNRKIDAVIGGPPCQDFSSAGKRTEGERANLTTSFAEIVIKISPSIFMMENVARSKHSQAYKKARASFVKSGYGLTEITLDASYCNVPQSRKRFFCLGIKGENDGFLNEGIQNNLSHRPLTVREYLGHEIELEHYYRHPRNYNRRAIFSVDEPAATIRGVNRPIPEGYKGHHNDSVKITKALRSLTTHERARIQTFPKNFQWLGTKTDVEQMIGNAVPVNLAFFVADCIKNYTLGKKAEKKKDAA